MTSNTRRSPNSRTTPRKARVDFDLDKLEREGDQPEPFTFRHGDKTFTLADPADIDYRDIVEMGSAGAMGEALIVKRLLGDQYDVLVEAGPLPQWKIEPLLTKWREHYSVPDPGEAGASPASSNGTARR